MSRLPRKYLDDGVFHITARGVDRTAIYRDDDDCETFIQLLRLAGRRVGWTCAAYCLMPNHYHLVLASTVDVLSRGMHRLNTGYAHYFNRRHGRTGHLFQCRFDARVVEGDEYFEAVCLYVAANPVRAGLCERVEDWRWSAFNEVFAS